MIAIIIVIMTIYNYIIARYLLHVLLTYNSIVFSKKEIRRLQWLPPILEKGIMRTKGLHKNYQAQEKQNSSSACSQKERAKPTNFGESAQFSQILFGYQASPEQTMDLFNTFQLKILQIYQRGKKSSQLSFCTFITLVILALATSEIQFNMTEPMVLLCFFLFFFLNHNILGKCKYMERKQVHRSLGGKLTMRYGFKIAITPLRIKFSPTIEPCFQNALWSLAPPL